MAAAIRPLRFLPIHPTLILELWNFPPCPYHPCPERTTIIAIAPAYLLLSHTPERLQSRHIPELQPSWNIPSARLS
jgi:hypothetical protein